MGKLQRHEWILVGLLVLVGVIGRLVRPEWHFTPLAAVALFAGYTTARPWLAGLVAMVAIAVSNLFEPAHSHLLVAVSVYACMLVPAFIGAGLRLIGFNSRTWPAWIIGVIVPSMVFFVVTNLMVWLTAIEYAPTWAGLVDCYAQAVPFYRPMLAGDLFWTTILFGSWAWATRGEFSAAPVEPRK